MDIREQKIRLWLKNPPEMKFPEPLNLPKFTKQSFRNYQEMNAQEHQHKCNDNTLIKSRTDGNPHTGRCPQAGRCC